MYCTVCSWKVFLLYDYSCEWSNVSTIWIIFHIDCRRKIFLAHVFFDDFEVHLNWWTTFHTDCTRRNCFWRDVAYELWVLLSYCTLIHTGYTRKAYPLCGPWTTEFSYLFEWFVALDAWKVFFPAWNFRCSFRVFLCLKHFSHWLQE